MSARYFSRKLWGRMRYAPTLTDEKGAFPLFVGRRGRADLVGMGFSNSLGIGKLGTFFLCFFLLFLS